MNTIIRHRGPDGEGFILFGADSSIYTAGGNDTSAEVWSNFTPYKPMLNITGIENSNIKVAFGHRRLFFIDLSPLGHCPMSYDHNKYWITYNGEIYNYLELKNELIELGHSFILHTDTEVILGIISEIKKE